MIQNIAYYPLQTALNASEVLNAFLQSCRQHKIVTKENSYDADAAVIWSVLWNGRMLKNRAVYSHYRQQNKPVIIIDVGALHRNTTWKIAVNNINALGHYGHTEHLDYDRPKKLNIAITPHVKKSEAIMLAAQNSRSLQVEQLTSMEEWVNHQIRELRLHTDRSIIVRPHPRSPLNMKYLFDNVTVEEPKKVISSYDSFDFNANYHTIINYNSGPGIQAALQSCPVIVDKSSLAAPMSMCIDEIEHPPLIDREQWLVEIAHTEYTVDEIRSGQWITRLEQYL